MFLSGCKSATNGVLQDLVLGPLLFVIYLNDLYVKIGGMINRFVDGATVLDSKNVVYIRIQTRRRVESIIGRWN